MHPLRTKYTYILTNWWSKFTMFIYWNPDMHYILQWREYTLSAEIVMEERHMQAGRRQERE